MALVLNTTLKMDGKVVAEGTPFSKLSKDQKALAKELGLLSEEREPELEEEDEDEAEEAETEDPAPEGAEEEK